MRKTTNDPQRLAQDDSEAFGAVCACAALCCGVLECWPDADEAESVETLERAIDVGLVRTIVRSLHSAALRGAFEDMSLRRCDGTLELLTALLRDAPSGRARADFIADGDAAVGHLVAAVRGGAPTSEALLALSLLINFFNGGGGTTALRTCGFAARHGACAAVTHTISAALSDRSLGSDDFCTVLDTGARALSSLHFSGSLKPEEVVRARETLTSAQKQLAQRWKEAASPSKAGLERLDLDSFTTLEERLATALAGVSKPPPAPAVVAKIAKEADVKAAKTLAAHDKEKKRRAQLERRKEQQQEVAANCYTCGRGPALEDGAALKLCGGCRKVRFCSVECSKSAWKEHKKECRAWAAAAAAAARERTGDGGEREGQ